MVAYLAERTKLTLRPFFLRNKCKIVHTKKEGEILSKQIDLGELCHSNSKKVVRLGTGGSLSVTLKKVRKRFRPRYPLWAEKTIKVDNPGSYTLLATRLYPLFMAILRSLEDKEPPALVLFDVDRATFDKSELFLSYEPTTKKKGFSTIGEVSFEDLKKLALVNSPIGGIVGGLFVNSIPSDAVVGVVVAESVLTERSLELEALLAEDSSTRHEKIWRYLIDSWWGESWIQDTGLTSRIIREFERKARFLNVDQFLTEYKGRS